MLLHCGLLLLFLNCVRTTEYVHSNGVIDDRAERFSWWPSVHNAASLVRVRRQAEKVVEKAETEGGAEDLNAKSQPVSPVVPPVDANQSTKVNKTADETTQNGAKGDYTIILLCCITVLLQLATVWS